MRTVQTILQQLTDPTMIMAKLRETLRAIDPEFPNTEVKYLAAASRLEKVLGNSITPSAGEFLAAAEEKFICEIIYIGWQGFQLNADIFHAPVNALLLQSDYEDLLRERRLEALPTAKNARDTIDAFYEVIREGCADKMHLTDGITEFYSYLQTTGYKLAHYFGFRLADQFLPYVIPGYTDDSLNTDIYKKTLQAYLKIDIGRLEE